MPCRENSATSCPLGFIKKREIIPHENGIYVDIDATVHKVCTAAELEAKRWK